MAIYQTIATAMLLAQLYFLYLAPISPYLHGLFFLTGILILTFLRNAGWRGAAVGGRIHPADIGLCLFSIVPLIYILQDFIGFVRRGSVPMSTDILIGVLFIALLIEAGRRVVGWILPVLALIAIAIALSALVLPSAFQIAPELSLRRVVGAIFQTELGIFSEPTQVAMRWIFLFLVFGQCLLLAGGQKFFIELAMSIAGKLRGGPAYMSVITSALFGTLSGSNMANVMVTGQFTIPWILRAGYSRTQAAAIESVSSTAGALTPPIMGAGALIMAELTGTPYSQVILAAILPAVLYYIALGAYTYGLTKRMDVEIIEQPLTEPVLKLCLRYWPVIAGLGWLVYQIVSMYPLERAVLEASAILLIGGLTSNAAAYTLQNGRDRVSDLAAQTVDIGLACALSGILIGVTLITGWGVEIASLILGLGDWSVLLAMFATMVVTIVLGMGTPGVAAYIITASVVAAPLGDLGLFILGVHLFIFYFSNFAGITPPVALTAFAAAGIAKSNPFRTGFLAMVMALPTYIVAYAMVLRPELLMQGAWTDIAYATASTALGVIMFALGSSGTLVGKSSWPERIVSVVAGLMLIDERLSTDIASMGIISVLLIYHLIRRRGEAVPNA
ncbi:MULTISPECIES: TRAP transporter fused permease subunit [unclassified Roseobacter]|uniref:TRAP transporter permease n=1 Tax=unclassified Roseobacter TaxID=196798 RepID=UPI00209C4152|nr:MULTISPECIES: TRAP transporter fused permease subunit [unclassified Roseobacter]